MPHSHSFFSIRRKKLHFRRRKLATLSNPLPSKPSKKETSQNSQEVPSTPLSKTSKQPSVTWTHGLVTPPPRIDLLKSMTDKKDGITPIRGYFAPNRKAFYSPSLPNTGGNAKAQHGLKVLHNLKKQFAETTKFMPDNIWMVFLQHAFPSTASLLVSFIELGINPKHMYFTDKVYSTTQSGRQQILAILGEHNTLFLSPPAKPWLYGEHLQKNIAALWERIIADIDKATIKPNKIILIGDGGRLFVVPTELLKYPVYGTEQTMHGQRFVEALNPPFLWNSVAICDMKRLEDALIGAQAAQCVEEVLSKLSKNIDLKNMRFGIIGLGNIGKASAQALINKGCTVFFYDPDASRTLDKATKCQRLAELIVNCNFIIGCTGKDALKDTLEKTKGFHIILENKFFMSMSSEAIEFAAFMQQYQNEAQNMREYEDCILSMHEQEFPIFPDLRYMIEGHTVTIINAGYPVNLQHDMDPRDIAITRAALFGAGAQWIYRIPQKEDNQPGAGTKSTAFEQSYQDSGISLWQKFRKQKDRPKDKKDLPSKSKQNKPSLVPVLMAAKQTQSSVIKKLVF